MDLAFFFFVFPNLVVLLSFKEGGSFFLFIFSSVALYSRGQTDANEQNTKLAKSSLDEWRNDEKCDFNEVLLACAKWAWSRLFRRHQRFGVSEEVLQLDSRCT